MARINGRPYWRRHHEVQMGSMKMATANSEEFRCTQKNIKVCTKMKIGCQTSINSFAVLSSRAETNIPNIRLNEY